jgi:hypothetical protein
MHKRVAILGTLSLVLGLTVLSGPPVAHATQVCVGVGTNPLPGTPCPNPDPSGNVFDINVCVMEPSDGSPGDGPANNPPNVVNISRGPVEAWADFTDPTGPQGELEVNALGTDTGITSNGNPDC